MKRLKWKVLNKNQKINRVVSASIFGSIYISSLLMSAFWFSVPASEQIANFLNDNILLLAKQTHVFLSYFLFVILFGLLAPVFLIAFFGLYLGDFIDKIFTKLKIDLGYEI